MSTATKTSRISRVDRELPAHEIAIRKPDESLALSDAAAFRRSRIQHGAPGEHEVGMLTPGRREIGIARIKRSITSIDGEAFDQGVDLEEFENRWTSRQWAELERAFDEMQES